ncbi:MAG TPA: hypothetical protein VJ987_03910, partial [Anaerolineales bacterium]|nr:hypothetical protein [Anaerolineales bacterium]
MRKIISFLLLLTFILSACGEATVTAVPAMVTETDEDLEPIVYTDPSQPVDVRVEDLLKRMTLDEKIGQMTQVEKDSIQPGDITK